MVSRQTTVVAQRLTAGVPSPRTLKVNLQRRRPARAFWGVTTLGVVQNTDAAADSLAVCVNILVTRDTGSWPAGHQGVCSLSVKTSVKPTCVQHDDEHVPPDLISLRDSHQSQYETVDPKCELATIAIKQWALCVQSSDLPCTLHEDHGSRQKLEHGCATHVCARTRTTLCCATLRVVLSMRSCECVLCGCTLCIAQPCVSVM